MPLTHRPPSPRLPARVLVSASLAVLFLLPTGGAASAAEAGGPAVRWSLAPATAEGPDERRTVEHSVDPGGTVADQLAVHNSGDEPVTFDLTAADGFYTSNGRFDVLVEPSESTGAGTWITLPESVTVPGGETMVVPFSVSAPTTAQPGDHAAGITASVAQVQSADDGTSVTVRTRVGLRVVTRVTGELRAAASLDRLEGDYTTAWNAVEPGRATVSFDVTNDGNTRLLARGRVELAGVAVAFPAPGQTAQQLLPGDTRRITVEVDRVWPVVAAPAAVTLTPEVLVVTDEAAPPASPVVAPAVAASAASVLVWALPLPQLVVLLGVALLLWALLSGRRRARRRLEALVQSARDAGRAEAEAVIDLRGDQGRVEPSRSKDDVETTRV